MAGVLVFCLDLADIPDPAAPAGLADVLAPGLGVPQDSARVLKWLEIAVANRREASVAARDRIAAGLSDAQLLAARQQPRACHGSRYRDCGWRALPQG